MRFKAILALAALCIGAAAGAAPPKADAKAAAKAVLQGTVVRVFDGDSLLLRTDGDARPLEIRLQGIDAPEGCQDGGPQAREMLEGYVLDKVVTATPAGKDAYGRTLATLEVDGLNVNQRMVAEGHAWSIRTKWNRGPFVAQERMAQALKRGLHAKTGAVMPADFRQRNGPCQGGAQSAAASAPAGSSAPTEAASVQAVAFRCDGRTHCSQMSSCAEATFFLRHCPGVKLDGNADGVPCERQWCSR